MNKLLTDRSESQELGCRNLHPRKIRSYANKLPYQSDQLLEITFGHQILGYKPKYRRITIPMGHYSPFEISPTALTPSHQNVENLPKMLAKHIINLLFAIFY